MKHITKLLLASAILSVSWMTLMVLTQSRTVVIENVPKISPTPIPRPAYLDLRPELLPVCSCESSYEGNKHSIPQQFEPASTTVRTGRINKFDKGMCQINVKIHADAIKAMNINVETAEGNVAFANYLYDSQGLKPWNWSKSCWQ